MWRIDYAARSALTDTLTTHDFFIADGHHRSRRDARSRRAVPRLLPDRRRSASAVLYVLCDLTPIEDSGSDLPTPLF